MRPSAAVTLSWDVAGGAGASSADREGRSGGRGGAGAGGGAVETVVVGSVTTGVTTGPGSGGLTKTTDRALAAPSIDVPRPELPRPPAISPATKRATTTTPRSAPSSFPGADGGRAEPDRLAFPPTAPLWRRSSAALA